MSNILTKAIRKDSIHDNNIVVIDGRKFRIRKIIDKQSIQQFNNVLSKLKIKVSLNTPRVDSTNHVLLLAYTKQQASNWATKLRNEGYDVQVYYEVGAHIVNVDLNSKLKFL